MPRALIALAGFAAACIAFFGKTLLPAHPLYGGDFLVFFYPIRCFLRDYVLEYGRLPLWNPYLLCGYPQVADLQAFAMYPGGILFYVFSPESAYGWTVAIHLILASAGMFLFAGRMGYARTASFLAGLVYAFNGYILRHLYAGHLAYLQSAAWVPWLWWAFARAASLPAPRGWVFVAVCTALMVLGGHPLMGFYGLIFLLGLAVVRPWPVDRPSLSKSLIAFAACVLTGFALAGAQVIPTLEFMSWTTRGDGVSLEAAVRGSLRPVEILNLFFPFAFGNPLDATYWIGSYAHSFWESGAHAGALAALALLGFGWKTATAFERYCFVIFAASIFLALGKYNPLFGYVHAIPGVDHFRDPIRALFLAMAAQSILVAGLVRRMEDRLPVHAARMIAGWIAAGIALGAAYLHLSAVVSDLPPGVLGLAADAAVRFSLFAAAAFAILAAGHREKIGAGASRALLVSLTVLDLWLAGHGMIRSTEKYAAARASAWRIHELAGPSDNFERVYATAPNDLGNLTLLSRTFAVRGHNPLMLSHPLRLINGAEGLPPSSEDFFTHVVITRFDHPAFRMLGLKSVVDADRGVLRVLPDPLPRAIWIRDAVTLSEHDALRAVTDRAFDPAARVILTGGPPAAAGVSGSGSAPPAAALSACRFLSYGADHVRLEVTAPAAGYVVIHDVYYPGWRAAVDGVPAGVRRAQYSFRAVEVPAGVHVVDLAYGPASFRVGLCVSLAAALLCAASTWIGRRSIA